jgi:hypothetical protein
MACWHNFFLGFLRFMKCCLKPKVLENTVNAHRNAGSLAVLPE